MKVAMIGAGAVGKALAGSAVRAGHAVKVSAQHREHAEEAARATGAQAAGTNRDAVEEADVVLLAIPCTAVESVLTDLAEILEGKTVVDITNPTLSDLSGTAFEGSSMAEQIQRWAPSVKVVKAFNTILAARQADPVVDGVQLDGFVAADDDEAKRQVMELVRSIGFRPIDAGGLRMARALEEMGFLNISLQVRNNWPWQTGWKLVGPTD